MAGSTKEGSPVPRSGPMRHSSRAAPRTRP
jgi:hypothetical protein